MNAAVKTISSRAYSARRQAQVNYASPSLPVILLLIVVLISAFSVVYTKDLSRRLFIQYQTEQTARSTLYVDWGKLLLEQSTWSTQARIQRIAEQRLNMVYPSQQGIVLVRADQQM